RVPPGTGVGMGMPTYACCSLPFAEIESAPFSSADARTFRQALTELSRDWPRRIMRVGFCTYCICSYDEATNDRA
ncbi:MAG: hypothetical protein V2I26_06765, partial [Halieaceae bacterium]|nr:hypothetical protein [Halieaceae bacterium]